MNVLETPFGVGDVGLDLLPVGADHTAPVGPTQHVAVHDPGLLAIDVLDARDPVLQRRRGPAGPQIGGLDEVRVSVNDRQGAQVESHVSLSSFEAVALPHVALAATETVARYFGAVPLRSGADRPQNGCSIASRGGT